MSRESVDGAKAENGLDATADSGGSRVAIRTKLYFGVGAGGEAASMWTFNALLLIFYQQILGLPAGLASVALGLAILSAI